MKEPDYAFTIPSIHDDIQLDCRIYHPRSNAHLTYSKRPLQGAVIAHPYAPLGGCFDDPVVLHLTELFLGLGYVVTTFNFRGAGDSAGRTSWTGRPEVDDYASVIGLSTYYLYNIRASRESDTLSPVVSINPADSSEDTPFDNATRTENPIHLLLAGYSFGSLVISRLPPISTIVQRYETADRGTAASEIFLRARMLAKQTRSSISEAQPPQTPRGRKLDPEGAATKLSISRGSPVVVGGEETDSADRRRSRDSRRSAEVIRDVPRNIKSHIRRHSAQFSRSPSGQHHPSASTISSREGLSRAMGPAVTVRYLMVSPVLLPFTTTLLSPGLPFTIGDASGSGVLSGKLPTMVVFGSSDTFTSSKGLRQWAERFSTESNGNVKWRQIKDAGHFWREKGVMKSLQAGIREWLQEG